MSCRVTLSIRTCDKCQKNKTFNHNVIGPQVNHTPSEVLETF